MVLSPTRALRSWHAEASSLDIDHVQTSQRPITDVSPVCGRSVFASRGGPHGNALGDRSENYP